MPQLRRVTSQQHTQWLAQAQRYGLLLRSSEFALGCFRIAAWAGGPLLEVLTPLPADRYDAELHTKPVPVRFDRTPAGEVILPGRWWQAAFERLSREPEHPLELRRLAGLAARAAVPNLLLEANIATVAVLIDGIETEALPPGTLLQLS